MAIEEYESFKESFDSYYYDLFYELEKYKDETIREDLKRFMDNKKNKGQRDY